MEQLYSIFQLFFFLFAGYFSGKINFIKNSRIFPKLLIITLYCLLFFMGYNIGANPEVKSKINTIGSLSLLFAVFTVLGTISCLLVLFSLNNNIHKGHKKIKIHRKENLLHFIKDPVKLLFIVLFGYFSGLLISSASNLGKLDITNWILNLLLFLVGTDLAKSNINLKESLLRPEILIIPFGTIAGTLLGAFILSKIINLSTSKAMAVASGFGWYSLSGVIISDLGDPVLGSVAFLSNMLRESISLILIPILSKTKYPYLSIGSAGATSMDVTLPLIERSCGTASVPVSITNGVILSLLVPVLVPLFYNLH